MEKPDLSPPSMALQFVIYSHFSGWHHIFMPLGQWLKWSMFRSNLWVGCSRSSRTSIYIVDLYIQLYQLDVRRWLYLVEFVRMQLCDSDWLYLYCIAVVKFTFIEEFDTCVVRNSSLKVCFLYHFNSVSCMSGRAADNWVVSVWILRQ